MRILVLGSTGSAGGSVLKACLEAPEVQEVRSITRRPLGVHHPRLRSSLHTDFEDLTAVEEHFSGLNACFYCLGVSATVVREEEEYRRITVDLAVAAATTLRKMSPSAAFHFISGVGTGAESRFMWARVKAEAEARVMDLAEAVCWRPGFIDGEASDSDLWYHGALRPLFRLLRPLRSLYVHGEDLGLAMLQATREGLTHTIVPNEEIRRLADRWRASREAGVGAQGG